MILEVYTLADALGLSLYLRGDKITCKAVKTLVFDDLVFDVPVKVISSCIGTDSAAILVRTIGNLGLLMVAGYEKTSTVAMFIVDFARMGMPENIMESNGLTDPRGSVVLMENAIVAKYTKGASKKWSKVD